MEIILLIV